MIGMIIKGIAGFYYVHVVESGVYECKAKGIFRKDNQKPLVGDAVRIEVLDPVDMEGNIIELLPRKNTLIRPAVANVDQALVLFAVCNPNPHLNLLDRFLVMMESQDIPVVICFNKTDLAQEEEMKILQNSYGNIGYPLVFVSAKRKDNTEVIQRMLRGKTTVVAGPSGVGKSTLINLLQSQVQMKVGSLSEKIARGKHTTRHAELITINETSFIVDTPGFSSLYRATFEKEMLKEYFPEFRDIAVGCRYLGCVHIHEPGCAVKAALKAGKISQSRYENYCLLFQELQDQDKRRYKN
ncbi:MAG: ribosome small subunit-dependent GTPase A [Lachnospiraceae bacterium]|nr:ribosome small subunit-dependent GTPase A [Lachnospiraceae bacterium]